MKKCGNGLNGGSGLGFYNACAQISLQLFGVFDVSGIIYIPLANAVHFDGTIVEKLTAKSLLQRKGGDSHKYHFIGAFIDQSATNDDFFGVKFQAIFFYGKDAKHYDKDERKEKEAKKDPKKRYSLPRAFFGNKFRLHRKILLVAIFILIY